jgi:hypothetical protein
VTTQVADELAQPVQA